jgi:hypothetical protein
VRRREDRRVFGRGIHRSDIQRLLTLAGNLCSRLGSPPEIPEPDSAGSCTLDELADRCAL